ncbi:MAG: Spy/CpxP family protein refolding chaperone [Thermoanaerobaculia bacterium]
MTGLKRVLLGAVGLAAAGGLSAQHSPYMGLEKRETKALSDEQVAAYLAGDGMGFALPAELNHYPGPKHVLELAAELGLTSEQRARTEEIFREMKDEAQRLGREIVEREKHLDGLFAGGTISQESLTGVVGEIAVLQRELRVAHLRAHLEMVTTLTADQIALYEKHRGYHGAAGHPPGP